MGYVLSMDIDLTGFSPAQQQALCDLLILSMFADGHLTTARDTHLQGVLLSLGYAGDAERQSAFDAAVDRMRPFVKSIWQARAKVVLLARAFINRSQQKRVYDAVQDLMTADQHVSAWECALLSELRMTFRL